MRTQPKCFGHLSTGVPRSAELFNVTVCNPMHYDLYTNFDSQKHVEVVHPVTVERPTGDGKDVVFFASNGEVTSVNPKGVTNWKTEAGEKERGYPCVVCLCTEETEEIHKAIIVHILQAVGREWRLRGLYGGRGGTRGRGIGRDWRHGVGQHE